MLPRAAFVLLALSMCSCRSGPPIGPGLPAVRSHLEIVVTGGSKPFARPLDVAALPGRGEIAVADAGSNRVEIFDERGAWLRVFGQRGGGFVRFHDLRGIDGDAEGRVLCVDAGRAAVVAVDSVRGAVVDQVDFSGVLAGTAPELSDVVAAGGRIFALELNSATVFVGRAPAPSSPGTNRGARAAPRAALCALEPGLRLWCAEPRSCRVLDFSLDGAPLGGFPAGALRPGAACSPSGVAVGTGGRIFVSDAAQGVVGVYDARGALLGLLGDDAGATLFLDGPGGLAFDSAGRLLIAETGAQRVQVRRLAGTP